MTPWGAPKPVLRYHPGDLWIEFPFTAEYLKAIAAGKGETTGVKTRVETGVKSSVKILQLISENADITTPELATALHLTQRAIEKQIAKLRATGRIRRIGPDKGGHWEVLPDTKKKP